MANAVTAVYQKQGINFKSTVFNIALSGSYAGPEVVTLTSAASNPSAATVTGPAGGYAGSDCGPYSSDNLRSLIRGEALRIAFPGLFER